MRVMVFFDTSAPQQTILYLLWKEYGYVLIIACIDLSGVYQSGTAGLSVGGGMALHVPDAGSSGLLCGHRFHDDFRQYGDLKSA